MVSSLNLFNLTGMAFLLHFIPVSSQIIISQRAHPLCQVSNSFLLSLVTLDSFILLPFLFMEL